MRYSSLQVMEGSVDIYVWTGFPVGQIPSAWAKDAGHTIKTINRDSFPSGNMVVVDSGSLPHLLTEISDSRQLGHLMVSCPLVLYLSGKFLFPCWNEQAWAYISAIVENKAWEDLVAALCTKQITYNWSQVFGNMSTDWWSDKPKKLHELTLNDYPDLPEELAAHVSGCVACMSRGINQMRTFIAYQLMHARQHRLVDALLHGRGGLFGHSRTEG